MDYRRCVGVSGFLVIWPEGTTWDSQADALRLPNGELRKVGEEVSGGGGYFTGTGPQSVLADSSQRDRCAWVGETAIFNLGSDIDTLP